MSVIPGFSGRRESSVSSATIQKMLDENVRLIHSLMAHQRCGAVKEAAELQQALHRNLVYLATIADRTTTHAAATTQAPPQSGGVTTVPTGLPVQGAQPHYTPPSPGTTVPPQTMLSTPVNSSAQSDRSPLIGVPMHHPGPSTTVTPDHMVNQSVSVSASQSGLLPGPKSTGSIHAQVYPVNLMSQTSNDHEITQQDAPGAPHGMPTGP
ncbi:SSXT domain-containing protein [Fasciola hepatica]|uniref:SSXT domain-containing protein n=1 Tax=Fasciola hepatica TaxID=6192 RepID=A0A4E0QXN1_FASHE|nr:SSXT domain-containing protein [Fasciola hepatica]